MADSKLSELTALAEVAANTDLLYLDDISVTTSKSITAAYMRRAKVDAVIASGSITPNALQLITLSLGTAIALVISGSPVAGDIIAIQRKGSGAVTHTVTIAGTVTWDGTNDVANFADDGDTLLAIAESATRWIVLVNSGVTFS